MRGIQTKIYSDAIDDYATLRGLDRKTLDKATLNTIRQESMTKLEAQFTNRLENEKEIKAIEDENLKLLKAFNDAKLFEEDMFGYTEATTFEFRMERLYRIKDMILMNARVEIAHSDSIRKKEMSHETVAKLARLWYSSDNGKAKYWDQLVELGYVNIEDSPMVEVERDVIEIVKEESADGSKLQMIGMLIPGIGIAEMHLDRKFLVPFYHLGDIEVTTRNGGLLLKAAPEDTDFQYDDPFYGKWGMRVNDMSLEGTLDGTTNTGNGQVSGLTYHRWVDSMFMGEETSREIGVETLLRLNATFTLKEYDDAPEYLTPYDDVGGTWLIADYEIWYLEEGTDPDYSQESDYQYPLVYLLK